MERANAVTYLGNPLTLVGNPVSPGDLAPDATVLKQDLTPVRIHDYHVFLFGLKFQELLEPIVRPGEHRPRRLATKLPPRLGNHLG